MSRTHHYLGRAPDGAVYATAEVKDGRLSIMGVIGPKANGDATGGCGQIDSELRGHLADNTITDTPAWLPHLLDVWERWHLNDMRAGCEHQRAAWHPEEVLEVENRESKVAGQVYPHEHPRGLLCKPCEVCGYKYGSAWLREELPADVLSFLAALPQTDKLPAAWTRSLYPS